MNGVSVVINLAGSSIAKRWTKSYKNEIVESRVLSLQMLYQLLKKNKGHQVRQLVTASAIGIYPHSYTHYYTEDEKIQETDFLSEVVIKWEEAAQAFNQLGISVAVLRIGLVLSMKGGAMPALVAPVKKGVGATFGSGEQWQSWIHIEDLISLFEHLVEKHLYGVYNAVAPNPVTHKKMLHEIASRLHKPLWLPAIPKSIMKLLLGEMATLLYDSQRVCAKKVEDSHFIYTYPNLGLALDNLLLNK